jgi:hypothetical protein
MPSKNEQPPSVIAKVLATAAVWSIVAAMAWRLRHPMVDLALLGVGASLTFLIWSSKTEKEV